MNFALLTLLLAAVSPASAADGTIEGQPNLVKQANAPISSILQVRFQDSYLPEFEDLHGRGNTVALNVTMPLPAYRLLPLPQLSLLSVPAAVTLPDGSTGFGDVRFLDVIVLNAGHSILWGIGPTFVFPTADRPTTGQGKWQAGPAAAVAFSPDRWLLGVLAQNPISFSGLSKRADANALFLQPFVTYQFGDGWFVRSQPQMIFDWQTSMQQVPLDVGVGRVFRIGRQIVSAFVEPFWNVSRDGPAPLYGITFGLTLLYPDFWRNR
ncbi:MAG TPA: hypothetical protein VKW76_12215 [Candidatus Binatia bacterium]|nr:hypothetical protein [Candidatus Binatia bacterium]